MILCVAENREKWLDLRRKSIGASDTAAILGRGYQGQNAHTIWWSKLHTEPYSKIDEETLARMQTGKDMEPIILAAAARLTGLKCKPWQEFSIAVSDTHSWLSATLDATIVDPQWGEVPLELKNVGQHNANEWIDDDVPDKFYMQVQHQVTVMGTQGGYLCALIGGQLPVVRRIARNDFFIDAMMEQLTHFWHLVEIRVPPTIVVEHGDAIGKVIGLMYPQDSGETVQLQDEAIEWTNIIQESKERIKALEERQQEAENHIKQLIGHNSIGVMPNGKRWSWKTQTRKSYVIPEATYRVLRLLKERMIP